MKLWKKILIGFGVVLGILAILVITFDANRYKGYIEQRLSAALGRGVSIDKIEMKLSLVPTMKLSNLQIKNPDGAEGALFRADEANAVVYLPGLLRGRLEIRDMQIPTGRINITRQTDTKSNAFLTPANDAALHDFQINSLDVQQLFLTYNGKKHLFKDTSVKQLRAFATNITVGGAAIQITGSMTGLFNLLMQKDNFSFTADIKGWNAAMNVSGSVGSLKKGDGIALQLTAQGDNLKAFLNRWDMNISDAFSKPFQIGMTAQGTTQELKLTAVDVKLAETTLTSDVTGAFAPGTQKWTLAGSAAIPESLSQNWGLNPFACQFDLEHQSDETAVKNMTFTANRSDMTFAGKIIWQQEPLWRGSVRSHYLHIFDVWTNPMSALYQPETAAQIEYQPGLAATSPLDLSGLKSAHADLSVKMSHVFLTDNLYFSIAGKATINEGVLAARDLDIAALNGFARGDLTLSVQDTPSIAVNLTGNQLRLEHIPGLGGSFKNTPADVLIQARGQGETLSRLFKTMTGTIQASAQEGTIVSPWFNTLATAISGDQEQSSSPFFSTADKNISIACAALSLDWDKGRMEAKDFMALETNRVHFTAGGVIDLNAQTADVHLKTSRHEAAAPQKKTPPPPLKKINIRGPFDQLQIASDAQPDGVSGKHVKTGLCQRVLDKQIIGASFDSIWHEKPKRAVSFMPAAPKKPADFKQQFLEAVQSAP